MQRWRNMVLLMAIMKLLLMLFPLLCLCCMVLSCGVVPTLLFGQANAHSSSPAPSPMYSITRVPYYNLNDHHHPFIFIFIIPDTTLIQPSANWIMYREKGESGLAPLSIGVREHIALSSPISQL
ncbi:hypothetical protein BKA57DRAFT_490613 [Linnemannia elongata]|nr:hypothetical protein BKA57DRAFT_490613 [Linnemannia elongata]